MKILITGGTGFIGKSLCEGFLEKGYEIFVLTRAPSKKIDERIHYIEWDGKVIEKTPEEIDAIINLAGESIFSLRWTESKKKRIIESRVNSGKAISKLIVNGIIKPELVIQISATGYYGNSDEIQDESFPPGKRFLSRVVRMWEDSTAEVERYGVKRCIARLGIVFGKGGMLSKILPVFKFYMGGVIGNPEKWLSWIHIKDVVNSIVFLVENKKSEGVYNLVSPEPVNRKKFEKTLLVKYARIYYKVFNG